MDRNALAELLQALESRRDAEERRREERYTALIERTTNAIRSCSRSASNKPGLQHFPLLLSQNGLSFTTST
ncbi:UNVERIFIED_CONTAM: hypothetical protein FKN15_038810 [Acipenser sinensis]